MAPWVGLALGQAERGAPGEWLHRRHQATSAPAAPHLCPCCTRHALPHPPRPPRQVLDAFITLLYPTGNVTAGLDYGAGTLLPSHRSLTLLAAGYTDKAAYAGWYEGVGVADGAVDTGNNAWVGMAFAHYSAATGDDCYSTVAHDLLAALSKAMPCPDELQGFGSRLAPYPANYRSTEHNTDMFALSHMLGAAGAAVETRASAFVHGMWARHVGDEGKDPTYSTGTGNAMACDATVPPGPAAVNAQFSNCGHAP